VLRLLQRGLVFFTAVVLAVAWFMPQNQAIYALFAGIVGHFSGGLMMYLHLQKPPDPPGGAA
jgi:membrane associated rhomboid family serine protease